MNGNVEISKRKMTELEAELRFLRTVRSREAEAMLAEALSFGDPENNAEYQAAKSELEKIRGRIGEIEKFLSCAVVTEAEEKHLSEDFLAELKGMIRNCGLSEKQAEGYAQFCQERFEEAQQAQYGVLPSDQGLETLKKAQEIVSGITGASELSEYSIDRFVRIPSDQWQSAKAAIVKCFGCDDATVDALFREDPDWLTLTENVVCESAGYLHATLSDRDLSWRVFRRGILFGKEMIMSRIAAVLDMTGAEYGLQIIRADAEAGGWLFWDYYSDPVGCIAYMKECGLSPERILTVIEEMPNFLYQYKKGRKTGYGHDQEYIDSIIRKYQ